MRVLDAFCRYVVKEPGISVRCNLKVMAVCQMMALSIEHQAMVLRDDLKSF